MTDLVKLILHETSADKNGEMPHEPREALLILRRAALRAAAPTDHPDWGHHTGGMPGEAQANSVCGRCHGTGIVDDGEIDCYPDGTPYMNGPVKCVKDCPNCNGTATQHKAPAVPKGFKLVPIDPTDAMKQAGGHANSEWLNDDAPIGESRYARPMESVWRDMLAAAPEPGDTHGR